MLKRIKTPRQHRAALKRIDCLMDARAGTPELAELKVLAMLVERYEREASAIGRNGAEPRKLLSSKVED